MCSSDFIKPPVRRRDLSVRPGSPVGHFLFLEPKPLHSLNLVSDTSFQISDWSSGGILATAGERLTQFTQFRRLAQNPVYVCGNVTLGHQSLPPTGQQNHRGG